MDINVNGSKNKQFKELVPGDVFMLDGEIYMKVKSIDDDNCNCNYVSLKSGNLYEMQDECIVYYFDEAELNLGD